MNDNKKYMIEQLVGVLQLKGEYLNSSDIDLYEKADKLDVLLDTMKFLQNYDENVKVLNEYWLDKRYKEKFKIEREEL